MAQIYTKVKWSERNPYSPYANVANWIYCGTSYECCVRVFTLMVSICFGAKFIIMFWCEDFPTRQHEQYSRDHSQSQSFGCTERCACVCVIISHPSPPPSTLDYFIGYFLWLCRSFQHLFQLSCTESKWEWINSISNRCNSFVGLSTTASCTRSDAGKTNKLIITAN